MLSEPLLLLLVTTLASLPGVLAAARARNAQTRLDSHAAAERSLAGQVARLEQEVASLRDRLAGAEQHIDQQRERLRAADERERRLVAIVREVLTALRVHDADTADRIRRDNPDLPL